MTTNPWAREVLRRTDTPSRVTTGVLCALLFGWLCTNQLTVLRIGVVVTLLATAHVRLDETSGAAWLVIAGRFLTRSRWSAAVVEHQASSSVVQLRGQRRQQWREAHFVGRLDLADTHVRQWGHIEELLRRCAVRPQPTRFALTETGPQTSRRTYVRSDVELDWPTMWQPTTPEESVTLPAPWYFEGWSYVQCERQFYAVMRIVRDTVDTGQVLTRATSPTGQWRVTTLIEVQPRQRALRQSRRTLHATRSSDLLRHSLGFSSSSLRGLEARAVAQREADVAAGDALVRLVMFVTCVARSRDELVDRVRATRRELHASGFRVQRGGGQQIEWFAAERGAGA